MCDDHNYFKKRVSCSGDVQEIGNINILLGKKPFLLSRNWPLRTGQALRCQTVQRVILKFYFLQIIKARAADSSCHDGNKPVTDFWHQINNDKYK